MLEGGVIDPVRVTRLTIENAASVAALLLTTEAVVAEELLAQPGAIIAPGLRRPRGGARAAELAGAGAAELAGLAAQPTTFATSQRCLPSRRVRSNPWRSNIETVPLWRNDGGDRAAVLDRLGEALHGPASEPADLVQRARERGVGDPAPPVPAVDEEAGDPPVRECGEPSRYARRCLMRGSSSVGPNWRTSRRRERPVIDQRGVRAALAHPGLLLSDRFCAGVFPRPTPSAWKPMHQQPPQTPLLRSTRLANSGHDASSSGRTRSSVMSGAPAARPRR